MRIGGKTLKGPSEEILILPRDGGPIVLRAKAPQNLDEFWALCPLPKAPTVQTKDGPIPDPDEKITQSYRQMLAQHDSLKLAYLAVVSLEPSQIEWDTVKIDQPRSWLKWQDELRNNGDGLTDIEINKVTQLVIDANMLNEAKLERARELFLLGQAQAVADSYSPSSEPANTPSGEPAA